ncbi:YkgJ family cysteine cluster protein [Nanoarchaeota archaeon]
MPKRALTPKNFKCDRKCGECCKKLSVIITKRETNKLEKLGYSDFVEADLGTKGFVLRRNSRGCVFLKKERNNYICKIYDHRPRICKIYPFFGNPTTCKPLKRPYNFLG